MKKLLTLFAFFGMVAIGCTDDINNGDNKTEQPGGDFPENIFFATDKESATIAPDGGSVDVIVYSNYKWEISGTSDWCTPSVKSGSANEDGQKVSFTANIAYDDREATFWFRCAAEKIKFVVSQKLKEVIIPDENNTFDIPTEGGIAVLSYQATVDCEIIIPLEAQSWISIANTRALANNSINLDVAENTTYNARTAVVKVVAKGNSKVYTEYTINQKQKDAIMTDENNTLIAPSEGGDIVIDYQTNVDCEVIIPEEAQGWITLATETRGLVTYSTILNIAENNTGEHRQAIVKVVSVDNSELFAEYTIIQDPPTTPLKVVYLENFDKKEAVKDASGYWPWLKDTAADYTNPQGSGAANVAYESANVTVRANSMSNGSYSAYEGSGLNNLFFGARINYVTVSGIEMPAEGDCFVLTFGSEKFSQEGDSTFNNDEFHVYISSDNTLWSEIEYAFEEGDELSGRWNDAKASFRLASVPSTLSIMVSADVASVYRLDDLQLLSGGEGAQFIDLTQGVENPNEPDTPDTPDTPVEGKFFSDNFDKKEAVKDASGYWPWLKDTAADYTNPQGSGAANVAYESANVTVRANSMSNGSYSAYEGSGLNNLFFGMVENYAIIKDITLPEGEDTFMMTFGAEKYTQNGDSVFKYDEFHVYLSADNSTWSEINYAFEDGDNLDGTWNDATATFRLTEVPAKLSVKFSVDAASAYRLDDLTLGVAESATQYVTLSEGTTSKPEVPTPDGYAGRDDFATVSHNSSYIARKSVAGWVGENCAVQSGGASDANPVLPSLLGSDPNTRAWAMNGKTSAVGKITSPVLTTGCGTLKFTYGLAFTDTNGFDFDVEIIQNGEVVKTINVKHSAAKYEVFTFEEEINVAGEFQIVMTNNCPSATDGNKDRYSIWDVMWTAHN